MPVAVTQPVYPPSAGQPVEAGWGDAVSETTIQHFPSAALRDANWTAPSDGAVCWTDDTKQMYLRTGGVWTTFGVFPTGVMMDFGGGSAPAGWLLCDGTSYPRATYPALFAVIGAAFGAADSSHFSVPDCRGRMTIGSGTGTAWAATNHPLGQGGGEETHALNSTENGYHNHGGVTAGATARHTHAPVLDGSGQWIGIRFPGSSEGLQAASTGERGTFSNGVVTGADSPDHAHGVPVEGGQPHNNMPPWITTNKIIKI